MLKFLQNLLLIPPIFFFFFLHYHSIYNIDSVVFVRFIMIRVFALILVMDMYRLAIRCSWTYPGCGWMAGRRSFVSDGDTSWSTSRRFCWKKTKTKMRTTQATAYRCEKRPRDPRRPWRVLRHRWVSFAWSTLCTRSVSMIDFYIAYCRHLKTIKTRCEKKFEKRKKIPFAHSLQWSTSGIVTYTHRRNLVGGGERL